MRKFADKEQRTNGSKTETTLSSVDTRGSWPIVFITTRYKLSQETLTYEMNKSRSDDNLLSIFPKIQSSHKIYWLACP